MKANMPVLLVGVVLIVLGIINYFVHIVHVAHVSIGLAIVGVIVSAAGIFLGSQSSSSK
jgi:hypothetical protein